ncbi:MAG: PBP1A family penicillin-binding protein [Candidatus Sumerlaeaceae bacterium]|nr:PBP1A family penicillin-binding protein [Candidatus Sumerlaeaceae bacterium]
MSRYPLLRNFFYVFLFIVLLLVFMAGVAAGAFLGYLDSLPPLEPLQNYNPPEVSRVFDRTGNTQLAELFNAERREFVPITEIPEHVKEALIAIEDERFYSHFGVDIRGIIRALKSNLTGGKVQGASTLTMQVARNIVLQDRRRVYSRKLKEIFTALQIERNFSKDQILEFYLNHMFFGERSNGIQAAARTYFNKSVKDLTVPEAALIAGLLKAPSSLSPMRDPERAKERRNLVLGNMRRLGFIKTDEEFQRYLNAPVELNPAQRVRETAPYFVDYVRYWLTREKSAADSAELSQKGYTIIGTVDLTLQKICEEELSKGLREVEKEIENQKAARFDQEASALGRVKKGQARLARIKEVRPDSIVVTLQGYTGEVPLPKTLPYFDPAAVIKPGKLIDVYIQDINKGKLEAFLYDKTYVQGAAVLLDVRSGEILALVGGNDFFDNANNGQWNRAYLGGRQPGSCWKPLLYASAVDMLDASGKPRFTPASVILDEPLSFPDGYAPKNYEGRFYGPTCLQEALVKSRNIPTIKLFMEIGPRNAVPLYHRFNMVSRPSNWQLDPVPSMPLGTPNVTPLELAAAYAVIANAGEGIQPHPIRRRFSSKDPTDSSIERPDKVRVLSPQGAYIATRMMMDVVRLGTARTTVGKWIEEQRAKGRQIPEVAGKTGTTNNCFVAWFVGFTPELVLAIYVGYDQHRTMGPKMVGGKTVGPIWVAMMDRILHTRGDWKMQFDVPPGITFADICSKSGKRPTEACFASGNTVFQNAAFKAGSEPTGSCQYHVAAQPSEETGEDVEATYEPAPVEQPRWGFFRSR